MDKENPFLNIAKHLIQINERLIEQGQVLEIIKNSNAPQPSERYIDKREASSIAAVSISTIDNWRRGNKIIPYYFDSVVRFKYNEFLQFLEDQKKSD